MPTGTVKHLVGKIDQGFRWRVVHTPALPPDGQFDLAVDNTCPADFTDNEKFLYFDEITGEVKLLVTMENNPNTGQIIVRQVEYIE